MTDAMERANQTREQAEKLADDLICATRDHEKAQSYETKYTAPELQAEREKVIAAIVGVQRPEEDYNRTQRPDGTWAADDPQRAPQAGYAKEGERLFPFTRDELGRFVREAWMRWARTQPSPKESWLVPYDFLPASDKEADRQVGEALANLLGGKLRPAPQAGYAKGGAVAEWFKLHDAYRKASDAYNARLAVVNAERERGNWSLSIEPEYRALSDAQRFAIGAAETLYQALSASPPPEEAIMVILNLIMEKTDEDQLTEEQAEKLAKYIVEALDQA